MSNFCTRKTFLLMFCFWKFFKQLHFLKSKLWVDTDHPSLEHMVLSRTRVSYIEDIC